MWKRFLYLFGIYQICAHQTNKLNDDDEHPLVYPYESNEWVITAQYGYKIQFEVTHISIKSINNDFLLIKQGEQVQDLGTGILFTNIIKKSRTFVINSNKALIHFEVNNADNTNEGFELNYKRIGKEMITTTENPFPSTTWPAPEANDDIYLHTYVDGKSDIEYKDETTLNELKNAIANMAVEYCNVKDIKVTENITLNNVLIYELKSCPFQWPNSAKCVQLLLALPIIQPDPESNYKLLNQDLEIMWSTYARKYLQDFNLLPFEEPNISKRLVSWGLLLGFITAIFAILLVVILGVIVYKKRILETFIIRNSLQDPDVPIHDFPEQSYPEYFEDFSKFQHSTVHKNVNTRDTFADFTEFCHINPAFENTEQ